MLATQDGYTATSAAQSGSALPAGVVPAFSAPVATADGFTFDVTNYDPNALYTLGASNGGTAAIDSEGHVTVTGLAPGDSSTVDVMVSVSGSLSSFGSVTGTALLAGVTPAFSAPTSTADGFTFDITNYDPSAMYTFSTTGGVATVDSTGHVTVTGVVAGESSTVTVTAIVNGSTEASDSLTGQALAAPVVAADADADADRDSLADADASRHPSGDPNALVGAGARSDQHQHDRRQRRQWGSALGLAFGGLAGERRQPC